MRKVELLPTRDSEAGYGPAKKYPYVAKYVYFFSKLCAEGVLMCLFSGN